MLIEILAFQMEEVWKKSFEPKTFATQKNLPYTIFMKKAVLKMYENGQLHQIIRKWESSKPECTHGKGVQSLSFKKLISMFSIIPIGVTLALMVVIHEYYSSSTAKEEEKSLKEDDQFENFKSLIEEINCTLKRKERPSTDLLFLLKGATEKLKQN